MTNEYNCKFLTASTSRKRSKTLLLTLYSTVVLQVLVLYMNTFFLHSSIESTAGDGVWNLKTTEDPPSKSLMVIAVFPKDDLRKAAIWSQLECFSEKFDRIIISAPPEFEVNVTQFIVEVKENMPNIGSKLEAQFYHNDRYDLGLWCDALTKGNIIQANQNNSTTYVGGLSHYDQFLLINDSLMAVERSNEFLESLEARNASIVSLSEWRGGDPMYWLESPARAFSLEGMQIFADNVCSVSYSHDWRINCPHRVNHNFLSTYRSERTRRKRCIVEKTEIGVAGLYPRGKAHGLYPGQDDQNKSWSINYEFWSNVLRDRMSIPAVKTSSDFVIGVRFHQPDVIERCMSKTRKFMDWKPSQHFLDTEKATTWPWEEH